MDTTFQKQNTYDKKYHNRLLLILACTGFLATVFTWKGVYGIAHDSTFANLMAGIVAVGMLMTIIICWWLSSYQQKQFLKQTLRIQTKDPLDACLGDLMLDTLPSPSAEQPPRIATVTKIY